MVIYLLFCFPGSSFQSMNIYFKGRKFCGFTVFVSLCQSYAHEIFQKFVSAKLEKLAINQNQYSRNNVKIL